MAKILVKFELKKSKDSHELVTLERTTGKLALDFGDEDKAEAELDEGALYFVRWSYGGKIDDEMSVTWSTGGTSHTLIAPFKLDRGHARLGPDGLWVEAATTGFIPYGEA